MQEAIRHDAGQFGALEHTGAVAPIEIFEVLSGESRMELPLLELRQSAEGVLPRARKRINGVSPKPIGSAAIPEVSHVNRYRVLGTERDEVSDSGLIPMGQVSLGDA